MRQRILLSALLTLILFTPALLYSAEKLKFGTSVKVNVAYFLAALAAEEGDYWKKNGLEGEWVPFRGGPDMFRAVAAGHINVGASTASMLIMSISRGAPVMAVSELMPREEFPMWVLAESRIKDPKELRGRLIGVNIMGGISYAYAGVVTKSLSIEKEVRIVATGGVTESVAALRARAVEAIVQPGISLQELKLKGEVRVLVSTAEYLPKEWLDHIVFARRDFIKNKPETLSRSVRAVIQATDYIRANPNWVLEKLRSEAGLSLEAGRQFSQGLLFTKDGKMSRSAIQNVRDFLVEYRIIPKEKAPELDEIYTDQFIK